MNFYELKAGQQFNFEHATNRQRASFKRNRYVCLGMQDGFGRYQAIGDKPNVYSYCTPSTQVFILKT